MKKWSIHVCQLDWDCRKYSALPRIGILTPWGFLHIAYWPSGKLPGRNGTWESEDRWDWMQWDGDYWKKNKR